MLCYLKNRGVMHAKTLLDSHSRVHVVHVVAKHFPMGVRTVRDCQ